MLKINPYWNIIKATLILVVIVGSFAAGWQTHSWKTDSAALKQVNVSLKQVDEGAKQVKVIVEKRDSNEIKERIVYRTIKEKINDIPSDNVCFSPESLQLWNSAIQGADSHRTEPDETTPTVDTIATEKEVLRNATDNFETCKINSEWHKAAIDELKRLDGKVCYCGD